MFCIKCGTQVEDDAKICPTCGANLAEEDINKNDVKTFLLGTQEERERKKAFIKAQMEKGKKTVSEQMENGKKALSEQKKKWKNSVFNRRLRKMPEDFKCPHCGAETRRATASKKLKKISMITTGCILAVILIGVIVYKSGIIQNWQKQKEEISYYGRGFLLWRIFM